MISTLICATGIASATSGAVARRAEIAATWPCAALAVTARRDGADLSARRRGVAAVKHVGSAPFYGTPMSTRLVVSTDLTRPPV
ncbi:hypothetical protein MM440_10720 [Arsenicicoccus piscis]|uniref:Secreted protein n=1 Tax=Arsenicicoccus piscis TaxID=673954 RepID=A0ABQ6HJZ3_9MICO|nr:hypothetical protein [Arsenicicoccus piscis]MCH8628237.1 hypothetical protein [Arsenicicoccus piscis]GMA18487.1 hypothetical protein GCM10025862_05080 [Arsenicicoccus piscis]